MKIHPELEAYRERLLARAEGWAALSPDALAGEWRTCREQIALLDRSIPDLRERLAGVSGEESLALARRIGLQEQLREMTAAYAQALRLHIEKTAS